MDIVFKTTKEGLDLNTVNWEEVAFILNSAGLSEFEAKDQETIFRNSYAVVLAYDKKKIIGVGRALSDGLSQAAIYNIALLPQYQGQNIGETILKKVLEQVQGQSIILYTHPRTVAWYEKYGFKRSKTAMCLYEGTEEKIEHIKSAGFILPDNFRFVDEYERADMIHKRGEVQWNDIDT